MRVPIACTLGQAKARAQLDEWREVLARTVTSVERVSPESAAMVLQPELTGLGDLLDLAQREKACCAFFDFRVAIEADRLRFVVTVPPDATDILDEFLARPAAPSTRTVDDLR